MPTQGQPPFTYNIAGHLSQCLRSFKLPLSLYPDPNAKVRT